MKKKIGMIFPGYGNQFVGMGKEIYDNSRMMQEYFDEASICLDTNFVKLCFASSDEDIKKVQCAYPLIFVVSISIAKELQEAGIEPSLVAGYNSGEFAALFAAGGINFADALYLLNKYALAYDELFSTMGTAKLMRVLNVPTHKLEEIIQVVQQETGSSVPIALYHSATEHIIGGFEEAVNQVSEAVLEQVKRAKCKDVHQAVGFHSALMDSVVNRLLMYAEKVDFCDLAIPCASNVGPTLLQTGNEVRESLLQTINKPLSWGKVLEQFSDCDILIEIGPGNSLQAQLQELYPDKVIRSINKPEDIVEIKSILGNEQPLPITESNDGDL